MMNHNTSPDGTVGLCQLWTSCSASKVFLKLNRAVVKTDPDRLSVDASMAEFDTVVSSGQTKEMVQSRAHLMIAYIRRMLSLGRLSGISLTPERISEVRIMQGLGSSEIRKQKCLVRRSRSRPYRCAVRPYEVFIGRKQDVQQWRDRKHNPKSTQILQ